jgi:hypothetical protein
MLYLWKLFGESCNCILGRRLSLRIPLSLDIGEMWDIWDNYI